MRLLLITYLSFVVLMLRAQDNRLIDSISHIAQTSGSEKQKALALCRLTHEYINLDAKKAYGYAMQSVELSEKIGHDSCKIAALNETAILDLNSSNYSKALGNLKKAIELAQESDDTVSVIRCFITVGDVYSSLLNYDKAIGYYKEAFELNRNKQNAVAITSLSRIGNRLMDKGREANDTSFMLSAIGSYLKVKDIASATGNTKQYINAYVSLADAYNIFGKSSGNEHHLYESLNYSMQSLQLAQSANLAGTQGISYLNLGEVYLSLNKTIKAAHYFELAEKIYSQLGDKSWLLNTYELLGKTYYTMHAYDKAVSYFNQAILIAGAQRMAVHLRDDYQWLGDIHAKQKKFEEACGYYKLYNEYKDSVINENTSFNISRLQAQIDLQRKDKEIALLTRHTEAQIREINSKKTQRNYLIILVVAILMVLAFVYYLYREKKLMAMKILKAKELAEKAKEAQEQFLANTSHEIRTPMNGIIGMTNHLIDTPLNKEQQEYINAIKESSNNLLSIINDLLDLSKIMAKKILFHRQPFELEALIRNLVHLLEFRAQEKNVRLSFTINPAIPATIEGDAVRLKQILLNLVENAVKFTHNGKITIAVSLLAETADAVKLEFSVTDTGIGIPENKLDMIFENFTQVNATTTRQYEGTGLGLPITKQLVEQQGGTVSVKSKLNEGSVFSFVLEFKKNKTITASPGISLPVQSAAPHANLNGAVVLVVDDNKINQRVASLTLQKWNIRVELADGAQDAYRILEQQAIDLVLMDITMPDIDGFEATRHIRTNFQAPLCHIPIIAMTAAAFIGDREKCLAAGMNDYISKPFVAEDLLQKILALLPGYHKKKVSDLSLIYERADGDKQFLKEIIECYILEMPVYIQEMEDCLQAGDLEGISKQAHKMKSPIALMGALELKDLYAAIEADAKQHKSMNELATQINVAQQKCLQTVEELKYEFEKL